MASLREYFESDFAHTVKLLAQFQVPVHNFGKVDVASTVNVDFCSKTIFSAALVGHNDLSVDQFSEILDFLNVRWTTAWPAPTEIRLPLAQIFPGQLTVRHNPFDLRSTFFGGPSTGLQDLRFQGRVYLYCDRDLSGADANELRERAKPHNLDLQFMGLKYREHRDKILNPLAFIIHDSRDKERIARPIALGLQKLLIPVWYDEFSLPVGAKLRESVEAGIKKCPKCVLIVTQNFLGNDGWTKAEFDAVFTKEIVEKSNALLPVWNGVVAEEVYEYSPWLRNIKAVNWNEGEDTVVTKLAQQIHRPYSWRVPD